MAAGATRELSGAGGGLAIAIAQVWLKPGSEWVLVSGALRQRPPAARAAARRRAQDLVDANAPGTGDEDLAGFALVPVPAVGDRLLGEAIIDPLLGEAMLHCAAGRTVIYYPEKQITPVEGLRPGVLQTRPGLEALLGTALCLSRSLPHSGPVDEMAVRLADCDQMPELLHPVGPARIRAGRITAWVCEKHLDGGLARWLGALCTAQASALRLTPPWPTGRAASHGIPGLARSCPGAGLTP